MVKVLVLWTLWCVLHSLLITSTVRQWIEHRGGIWAGLYRMVYIGVAVTTLLPLLVYTALLPQHLLAAPPLWVRAVQVVLGLYALLTFVGGARAYDIPFFLGLRQWREYRQHQVPSRPQLNTRGILRYLRHPWYSGGIAILWAWPLFTNLTLAVHLLLTAYLVIGAFLEERKMREVLGKPYQEYCRRTPMFFPWRFPGVSQL